MKKIKIAIFFVFVIIFIILVIFIIKNNKKYQNGNNDNNQILNMNSYEAEIEVTVKSNKNTNKYRMNQRYKKNEYSIQEIEEPENIRGIELEYRNNVLSIKNTNLNLSKMYQDYEYIAENNLFLNEFIDDFKNDSKGMKETDKEIILETECRNQSNKYQVRKKLIIDKQTNKPKELQVQDINQNITIYILYNEISYK